MLVCVNHAEREEILEYWEGRFGVPSIAFGPLRFLVRARNVWAAADLDGLEDALATYKIEAAGLPLLRRQKRLWKPTTAALLCLDERITRNVVDLTGEHLYPFLRGEILPGPFAVEPGYVAVRYGARMLGCALYGKAGLKSQLPRAWVAVLLGGTRGAEGEQ